MSVKVRTRRVTTYTITDNDREFEVEHQPHDGYSTTVIVKDLPDGRVIVGYLSHDDDPPDPFDGDGMGKIYDRRNMSREDRNELRSAMGWDEYDTRDLYRHSFALCGSDNAKARLVRPRRPTNARVLNGHTMTNESPHLVKTRKT